MLRRLDGRLEQAGLDARARATILDTAGRTMSARVAVLGDDEHFDVLHPARTLLILLDDCAVLDAAVLDAAASIESEHPALRVPPASDLAREVPLPDTAGDELLEMLIVADERTRLIALAERLDHARHLHLRDRTDWIPFHAGIAAIYAPVAQRTHDRLARRYEWWRDMFRRRFLESGIDA